MGTIKDAGSIPATSTKPTVIDAFCGAGGLSLGLSNAGFTISAAFDSDKQSIETYQRNLGSHGFLADIQEVSGQDLLDKAQINDLDLLTGGPPCQGFSKQNRGAHSGDTRNMLVLEFLRLIEEIRPQAFLMENVPLFAQKRGVHLAEQFFSLNEYDLTGHMYLAADYGVAQTRQRFVLVGIRKELSIKFIVPEPTTPKPGWLTVDEALRGLPVPPKDCSEHPDWPNHQSSRITPLNIERFSHVPQGGGWKDIPFQLRLSCHKALGDKQGSWSDVYGRLRGDGQSPTITSGFDSFTRGRYGHPYQNRPLTPREAARLQGFPDTHVFIGTRKSVCHQIGNAVPVPLAEVIGASILDVLRGQESRKTGSEGVVPYKPHIFRG